MIFYIIIIIMTILGAIASLFLKKASTSMSLYRLITNSYIYFGALLYLISAILNIFVLRFLDYSIVLPLTSLTYLWTMIISKYILGEVITIKKKIGIVLIITGIILINLKKI